MTKAIIRYSVECPTCGAETVQTVKGEKLQVSAGSQECVCDEVLETPTIVVNFKKPEPEPAP